MKVLVIGSGGRESCLVWKISKSDKVDKIYVIPGNPGMEEFAENVDIGIGKEDFGKILDFVAKKQIDLTVVGPEAPLVDGLVDEFIKKGFMIFGPSKNAAILEGSKVFTKELSCKYNIPTARSRTFSIDEYGDAIEYLKDIQPPDFPVVIKADGLAAGKGVVISGNLQDAVKAVDDCFK